MLITLSTKTVQRIDLHNVVKPRYCMDFLEKLFIPAFSQSSWAARNFYKKQADLVSSKLLKTRVCKYFQYINESLNKN